MAALLLLRFLLLWLPALAWASDSSILSPKGVNFEVAALMAMKKEMRDESGVMAGWDLNSVDPCTWNMVGCSPEGFVISLEMASTGLAGTLSTSIGNLGHLRTMLLQNNLLTGSIPAEIGKLPELQTLDLSGNQFEGNIPSSLGQLTRLSYLRLSRNRLSGQIPGPVANLTELSFLDLSYNNLSGPTPRILAKDYSIAGNSLLCGPSPTKGCSSVSKPINATVGSPKVNNGHHHWVMSVVLGFSCAFVVSLVLLVCLVYWYRTRLLSTSCVQQDYDFEIGHLKRFSFRELQVATGNFSRRNVLGQGGFGVVYRGCLPNKTLVAVKRLKDPNFTGEMQFQTEVEMIGLALHRNLLRLYGFCMTPEERMLVYPYMPNGSVADRLRGGEIPCLNWNRRLRIALGAARGLLYLHEQCNPRIIHRDVKAANILLDESFEAVVGDFGLAKLLDRRDSHVTTAVRGTIGHIAPEYLSTGQSSEKTDVFGFGILLLELITGQKALDAGNDSNDQLHDCYIMQVKTLHEEKKLEMLIDKDLKGCFDPSELEQAIELALQCTQSHPTLRPKMSEVLKVLEGLVGHSGVEEAQAGGSNMYEARPFSFSRQQHSGIHEASSFIIEAMELSGPR
ncbi:unnamed protein product [Linum tenue]|uniref:non-specific serine/threonine protein kinase n=1 Tax=Linum tenue TaxID=586396 RepID=A0AAV0PYK5_9ROSI|nr:unnamed protein product [Linum tenue]